MACILEQRSDEEVDSNLIVLVNIYHLSELVRFNNYSAYYLDRIRQNSSEISLSFGRRRTISYW